MYIYSAESCDTCYLSNKEEMEVVSTVQPYEGEPRASNEDFDEEWQRRFLACVDQIKIRAKNSRYWMLNSLCLCFIFCGEIYVNPLTPKSDWHLISPYNITSESNIKITRIKEMITN